MAPRLLDVMDTRKAGIRRVPNTTLPESEMRVLVLVLDSDL